MDSSRSSGSFSSSVSPCRAQKRCSATSIGGGFSRRRIRFVRSTRKTPFRTVRLAMAGDDSPVAERIKRDLASALKLEVDGDRTDDADLLIRSAPRCGRLGGACTRSRRARSRLEAGASPTCPERSMRRSPTRWRISPSRSRPTASSTSAAVPGRFSSSERPCAARSPSTAATRTRTPESMPEKTSRRRVFRIESACTTPTRPTCLTPGNTSTPSSGTLPFGQKIGSHKENLALYPKLLAESARVLKPGGKLVLLTHEHRLFEETFDALGDKLEPVRSIKVSVGGMNPKIYVASKPC